MKSPLLRLAVALAMLLSLAGLQPLALNANPAPVGDQTSVTIICSPPTIVSVTVTVHADGSITRVTVWEQSCTTIFTSADGTTSQTTTTHSWTTTEFIPAPQPVEPVGPEQPEPAVPGKQLPG